MPVVLDSLTLHGKQRTMCRDLPINKIAAYMRTHKLSIHTGHGDGISTGTVQVPINGCVYHMVLRLTKRIGMVQHAALITGYVV